RSANLACHLFRIRNVLEAFTGHNHIKDFALKADCFCIAYDKVNGGTRFFGFPSSLGNSDLRKIHRGYRCTWCCLRHPQRKVTYSTTDFQYSQTSQIWQYSCCSYVPRVVQFFDPDWFVVTSQLSLSPIIVIFVVEAHVPYFISHSTKCDLCGSRKE